MNIKPNTDFGTLIAPRTLEIQRLLPGPIERIWDYLTKSDLRRQWLASGEMELKLGAPFELTWRNDDLAVTPGTRPEGMNAENTQPMRITVCEPPHKLSFIFGGAGEVHFELKAVGEKVLLTLIHRDAPNRGTLLAVSAGWHAHLDVLGAITTSTHFEPFWDNWSELKKQYEQRIPADA